MGILSSLVASDDLPFAIMPDYEVNSWHFDRLVVDIPANVTLINAYEIEQMGAVSIQEILEKQANIQIRSFTGKASDGQISMRGFGENSGLRVLVIVDGQKYNRADMGAIEWQQIPLSDIESIEVLRGGQTVLYGDHALSGVVKITTKKGGESLTRLKVVGGSYDFYQSSLYYSEGTKQWDYDAGMDYEWDGGYRDHSQSEKFSAQMALSREFDPSRRLTLHAYYSDTYLQYPGPLSKDEFETDPRQSMSDPDDGSNGENALFTIFWESEYDCWSGQMNAGANYRAYDWLLDGTVASNEQMSYSFSPRAQWQFADGELISGVDLQRDTLDFELFLDSLRDALKSEAGLSRNTAGAYIFASWDLTDKLSLSGGIRYEFARTHYLNTAYDWSVRPNRENVDWDPDFAINEEGSYDEWVDKHGFAGELSLNLKLRENVSSWIGYDRVYRYPVLDETASYQGFELSEPVNRNLDPEEGNNFEWGIKYHDENYLFSFTTFYLWLENEIMYEEREEYDYESGELVSYKLNSNIGATERFGLELEMAYEQKTWGISTRWSMTRAKFAEGTEYMGLDLSEKTLALVPSFTGISSFWIRPYDSLTWTFYYHYTGSQFQGNDFTNQMEKLAPYGLVDMRFDYDVSDLLRIYLKANNIFDKNYAALAYSGGYYPGMGRSIQLGIRLIF